MNDSVCYAAVAFNSAGYISAVTSADYDLAVKTARIIGTSANIPEPLVSANRVARHLSAPGAEITLKFRVPRSLQIRKRGKERAQHFRAFGDLFKISCQLVRLL